MKELILENPPRRKGRKSKKRRSPAQIAAFKKMIAARKKSRPKARKARKVYAKRTRKASTAKKTVRKTYSVMARRKKSKSSRRKTRTYLVRGTASPIKLNGMIGSVFSRDNLTLGGGIVLGTVATNYALSSDLAAKLPGVSSPYTRALYNVLIPVLGGFAVKRFSPSLAKGMIIGGLANGIGQLVTASNILPAGQTAPVQIANAPATTGEYLGEYLGGNSEDESFGAFDTSW